MIYTFTTRDHPEADGRIPEAGDKAADVVIELEEGHTLKLRVGKAAAIGLASRFTAVAAKMVNGNVDQAGRPLRSATGQVRILDASGSPIEPTERG